MIEIRNLQAGYPGRPVLKGIHAHCPVGKITVLLGPNGCGKTTLLKALCGILPAKGQALLGNTDLLQLSPRERAQQLAYLSQSRPIPDLTVQQLVLCGRYPHSGYPRQYTSHDKAIAQTAMEELGVQTLADRPLSQLSGGQRQKVYIAMALAQDTPVILLDEPTTYLDIAHQLQLLRQLRALADSGKTVVTVLHDLPSALQTADHIVLMEEGTVVTEGSPDAVVASGLLGRVFGVKVHRFAADGRQHYSFEEV